ncbi:zinc ABC transporter substrate-binding protein [Rhizobium sp. KAs_5_22]|uniref:zinc ABC transporter substrate-binding protein ZnuA n=1 Tax=Ciceribacter selenitireducens TaxID=448181 RepID=UPI000491CBE6|nr:zinc ABC transporter substrate-binding protein ZnuA [Ciceribacter selenitireducens]PPJ46463.1 zinc ABC transporter substrate-binding protein [Rhizobium sp. KAs_5_22]
MTFSRLGLAASTAALLLTPTLALAAPQVVVSIKPIHSLVAAIMQGVGEPELIVEGAASAHTYSLRPSNARALENADVVFWVGPGIEAFLEKPLDALAGKAKVVELEDAPGLVRLPFREGGAFEAHDHEGEADHADGDEHAAHDAHADHATEEHAAEQHAGEEHDHEHEHGGFDMHLWLDPMNAKAMAKQIEETLVAADPANADRYKANGLALAQEIDTLDKDIATAVAPVVDKPFVVFHDAYQYFENRYKVRVAGSITVSPETMPGAERVAEIHGKVKELKAACVFAEPQFEPKLVSVVTEGTDAKAGTLDPEGGALEAGPALYPELMHNLAKSLTDCLSR